jgi:hypothetical protein
MVRISQASQAVNSSGEQIVEVSASSNVNVNDFTAQTSLSSIDSKITACDTTNLSTSANQTTANGLLSSMDSALSGTLAVSAVSLPLPTGSATSANQSTANGLLTNIDTALSGTLTVDGSASTQPVSGTVAVSSVSGTVATSAPSVSGTNNNHLSSQSVSSSYQSSGFDVSNASRFSIMGNTTDSSSSILVEFSADNTNWYRANVELYPSYSDVSSPYDFYSSFEGACVKYVRLNFANYPGTETVNATILTQ